jgi:hypothetical protein
MEDKRELLYSKKIYSDCTLYSTDSKSEQYSFGRTAFENSEIREKIFS